MITGEKDLLKMKEDRIKELKSKDIRIMVGMSSCGIAAGAEDVMKKFKEVLTERGLANIEVIQTGCVGYCYTEPTIEILRTDCHDSLLLGPVRPEDVAVVLDLHIINSLKASKYVLEKKFTRCC